jgi:ATP-binding cassette subfamily A (ABC1) protein 3
VRTFCCRSLLVSWFRSLALMALASFCHATNSAMTATLFFNWFTGFILPIVVYILFFFPSTVDIGRGLTWWLRLLPPFALGNGLLNCGSRTFLGFLLGKEEQLQPWDMDVAGADVLYLAFTTILYFGLTLLFERWFSGTSTITSFLMDWRLRRNLKRSPDPSTLWDSDLQSPHSQGLDVDVAAEKDRVKSGTCRDVVRMEGVKKAYPMGGGGVKVAVRDMWLGIPKGECFGLLGINGAGKTSTIATLCGEQEPTDGQAVMAGVDISTHRESLHRLIGYCPQFDALFESMTARETLRLYGRIKGLPEDVLEEVVQRKIEEVGLDLYADKLAGGYSGGNRRKLSVGIALIGEPEIIFLGEMKILLLCSTLATLRVDCHTSSLHSFSSQMSLPLGLTP